MSLIEAKNLNKLCSVGASLKDITFNIDEKGIYGFVGKSGSGKSALAELLAGVCVPDSGELYYGDESFFASERGMARRKKKIGYMPREDSTLGYLTVFEMLDMIGRAKGVGPDLRMRQIKEALGLVGLGAHSDVLCDSCTLAERRRVAFAAAMLGNPDIIILDEPLRCLEKGQADELRSFIEMLGRKKTVLLFTSRAVEAEQFCGCVAIMSGGEIRLWDRVDTILSKLQGAGLAAAVDAFSAESEA